VLSVRALNVINLFGLSVADHGQCPTEWQRNSYPLRYHDSISVIHEGVDTDCVKPDADAFLEIPGRLRLSSSDEVVTYVSRKLEPYRGFHVFMRALPGSSEGTRRLMRLSWARRKGIRAGASEGAGRGAKPCSRSSMAARPLPDSFSWPGALRHLPESAADILGARPTSLTRSCSPGRCWRAMAAGCCVIGSDTPPVKEVLCDGEDGMLVDFFDHEAIAEKVQRALARREDARQMGIRARQSILSRYDMKTICLPRHVALVESLASRRAPEFPIRPASCRKNCRYCERATRLRIAIPPTVVPKSGPHGRTYLRNTRARDLRGADPRLADENPPIRFWGVALPEGVGAGQTASPADRSIN